MQFNYSFLPPSQLNFMYDRNMLRIKPKSEKVDFGTMKSADGKQEFRAVEIQIHTPAEHEIQRQRFDMEV